MRICAVCRLLSTFSNTFRTAHALFIELLISPSRAKQLASSRIMLAVRRGSSIAISGPPNAGKSSLFNALCRTEVSIVSSTPGTTRDVVTADASLAGLTMCLADTAGIRQSLDDVENIGVDRALVRVRSSDIVVLLLDSEMICSRSLPHGLVLALLDCKSSPCKRIIGVLAKSDTVPASQIPELVSRLKSYLLDLLPSRLLHEVCHANSLGPEGVVQVESLILEAIAASDAAGLESNSFLSKNPALFARDRQLQLLQLVSKHLLLFCDQNRPLDIRYFNLANSQFFFVHFYLLISPLK
jgi:tRNA U34 5-carboxymethylaminomethyl modifying GTPase MnmE/TrmE